MTDEKVKLTDEKGFLTPRKHLIEKVIPKSVMEEYFDVLMKGGLLYACVTTNSESTRLFFEVDERDENLVKCRVFWRKNDAAQYVKYVKALRQYDEWSTANLWEVSCNDLIQSLCKICENKNNAKNQLTYKSLMCVYIDGIMEEVELFWSNNRDFML